MDAKYWHDEAAGKLVDFMQAQLSRREFVGATCAVLLSPLATLSPASYASGLVPQLMGIEHAKERCTYKSKVGGAEVSVIGDFAPHSVSSCEEFPQISFAVSRGPVAARIQWSATDPEYKRFSTARGWHFSGHGFVHSKRKQWFAVENEREGGCWLVARDIASLEVIDSVRLPGKFAHEVRWEPVNDLAVVVFQSYGDGTQGGVAYFNLATKQLARVVLTPPGYAVLHASVSAGGEYCIATGVPKGGSKAGTCTNPEDSFLGIAAGAEKVFAMFSSEPSGSRYFDTVIIPGTRLAFVSLHRSPFVIRVDLTTRKINQRYQFPHSVSGLVYSKETTEVLVQTRPFKGLYAVNPTKDSAPKLINFSGKLDGVHLPSWGG